jgi:hypothetical protein
VSKAPPMDEYELELINRLLSLHAERFEKLQQARSFSLSYEELSRLEQEIARINSKLNELWAFLNKAEPGMGDV